MIAGDNEDGKSTLLLALKAALFLKYKATVTEDFCRLQQGQARATAGSGVLAGRIRCTKRFVKIRAELVTPTGTLEGMAAEEELARLFAL